MTPASAAAATASRREIPTGLASWYTEGFRDGIGDRLLMFDNSGAPSLELLRFRPEFSNAMDFEDAVCQRVDELRSFRHPAFSEIRAVERLEDGELVLASTYMAGKRLSEIFWNPRGRAGAHPALCAWFIRELTSALAALQQHGSGMAHACLTADRVVMVPDGHLVIVEHVLGAALNRLCLPSSVLSQELELITVDDGFGRGKLDQRTDVIQLGWIALSLLVGRRLAPREYPARVEALLDEFVAATHGRSPAIVSALRRWLERALQRGNEPFESAVHAEAGLDELRLHGGPLAAELEAKRSKPEPVVQTQAAETADSETVPVARDTEFDDTFVDRAAPEEASVARPPLAWPAKAGWVVAAIFAVVAAVEATSISRLERAHTAPSVSGLPVVLDSPQPGDAVIVDGRQVGVTPLSLVLTSDVRSIRVRPRSSPPAAAIRRTSSASEHSAANPVSVAAAQAATRERRGGLRLTAPVEIQVLEGERLLGSSVDGPIILTAGHHELDFINGALGYRSHQAVDVTAGEIRPMNISLPDGRVSVNAVPWAQVTIDGNVVGETPLANIPLAVGDHEITFHHPQLGDQRQHVLVKSNALTRVSASFSSH